MHFTAGTVLLALSTVPTALAGVHSLCYKYFLEKDKCVFASKNTNNRCPVNKTVEAHPVPQGHGNLLASTQETLARKLVRRYDSVNTSYAIAGGSGICGNYSTTDHGVCLWVGTEHEKGDNISTAGWLNGALTKNCGRQIYIKRKGVTGEEGTVYAPVVDGCTFNEFNITIGCFRIAFTQATFDALKPNTTEIEAKAIENLVWDFDNLYGDKPKNAPF